MDVVVFVVSRRKRKGGKGRGGNSAIAFRAYGRHCNGGTVEEGVPRISAIHLFKCVSLVAQAPLLGT